MEARCVHENELGVFLCHDAADPVAGGLGLIRYDRDLFTYQIIGQGGFTYIGTAGNGDHRSFSSHNSLLSMF